jgi:hypothetical protein
MKQSMKEEIREYGLSCLVDLQLDENELRDVSEVHNQLFNMDYYIIGYYEADQWLKSHNVGVFEGIEFCKNKEEEHYGEVHTDYKDSEGLVNHLVYWVSMDLIDEVKEDYKQNILNK